MSNISTGALVVLAIIALPYLYVAARMICAAYYNSRLQYEQQRIDYVRKTRP